MTSAERKASRLRAERRDHPERFGADGKRVRRAKRGPTFTEDQMLEIEANYREGIARVLIRLRGERGWSQREAAVACAVSKGLWRVLEGRGSVRTVGLSTLLRVSVGAGMLPSELVQRMERAIVEAAREAQLERELRAAEDEAASIAAAPAPEPPPGGTDDMADAGRPAVGAPAGTGAGLGSWRGAARRCPGCGGEVRELLFEKESDDGRSVISAPAGVWRCTGCGVVVPIARSVEAPATYAPWRDDETRKAGHPQLTTDRIGPVPEGFTGVVYNGAAAVDQLERATSVADLERIYAEVTAADQAPQVAIDGATGEVFERPMTSLDLAPRPDDACAAEEISVGRCDGCGTFGTRRPVHVDAGTGHLLPGPDDEF